MTQGGLNPQQLRTIVEEKWQSDPTALAFGLHVSPFWKAPSEIDLQVGMAQVVRADTVVQVRETLLNAEKSKSRVIVLTKLQQADLGHDVVARLARSRLFPIDHVASLCGLFKAKELDRSIREPGIAHALLEYAPRDGYPPVSAGVLDAGTVWRAVFRHVFEMGDREPDLLTLLLWATTLNGPRRYLEATEELRESFRRRLVANLGATGESILRFIDSNAGPDAMALAVACQVIYGHGPEEVIEAAAARLEQYHLNKPISIAVGRQLGQIASDAIVDVDRRNDDPRIVQEHLQRADDLLRQFRCEEFAYRNDLSALGFEQRLLRFAEQIKVTVADPRADAIQTCEKLQAEVLDHRLAKLPRHAAQILRTKMAVRLARWLKQPLPTASDFSKLASRYVAELSFVDWAREAIVRGDDVSELSAAYQLLDEAVAARQRTASRDFAIALADWTSSGAKNSTIIGVEHVLESVVAKIAEAGNRVLLIVLDGMSWAVCHELLEDIRADHWFESTLGDCEGPPPSVVATVPSETKYSRTSLLSGMLTVGDASHEDRNFASHLSLANASDRRFPPLLFHKKDITQGSRGGISDTLSTTILQTTQRIVGVVLNAIDDRLANAQQIRDDWSISRIMPLGALLRLARDSGRVVILASDHGHVWHRSGTEQEASSEGSRWRLNDGECVDGELVIAGKRVLPPGSQGSVIVPWSEQIRYKRQQHGYHGGATPQEMICPLVILTDKSSAYTGLSGCSYSKPEWWSASPVAAPVKAEAFAKVSVATGGSPNLFDLPPRPEAPNTASKTKKTDPRPTSTAGWIDRLISSQAYRDQKAFVRRHAPEDNLVQRCLIALDAQGGIMTPVAFAKAADLPEGRLDGLISRMQRLLNVDGYEILNFSRNENRIELNIAKLKRQFDLE